MILLGIAVMVAGIYATATCGAMVQATERRLEVLRRWGHLSTSWDEARRLEWRRVGLIAGVVAGVAMAGFGAWVLSTGV